MSNVNVKILRHTLSAGSLDVDNRVSHQLFHIGNTALQPGYNKVYGKAWDPWTYSIDKQKVIYQKCYTVIKINI